MARLLSRVAMLAAVLLGLSLGALFFASTETGFRVLVRPLLASQGVEVGEGRISLLAGEVEASGLRWEGGGATRLAASVEPRSLLPGRRPHILSLEIEALELDLHANASDEDGEGSTFSIPAFVVETGSVSILRLRQLDAEGNVAWQLGPAEITLDAWTPGQEGQLKAKADFALPSADPARNGSVEIDATLSVPEASQTALDFRGTLDVKLAPDGLALHAEPAGSFGDTIDLKGPIELTRKGKALIEGGALEFRLDAEGNTIGLVVKRASADALLRALGNPRPVTGVRQLDLGLDARVQISDGSKISVERFIWKQSKPGADPVTLDATGTLRLGAKREASLAIRGPGVDGSEGSAQVELAEQVLDLKIPSLDLTALLDPWLEDERETEEASAPTETASAETNGGSDLTTRFEIGALRYRELLVRDARGTLRQKGDGLELELVAARVGEGSLAGTFLSGVAEGQRKLDWNFDAKQLDLTELFRSLDPTSDGQLAGKLDFVTKAGASVPADQDPLDALMGSFNFKLRDAKANDLPFQKFMASKLAVGGLASLAFTGAEGEIPIEKGRFLLDDFYVDGNAANFRLRGSLSARDIDLSVSPRLGPRLASDLAPKFADFLLETASGALALPVAFVIEGPWAKTAFNMRPAPPSLVGDIVGGTADVLKKAGSFLFGLGQGEPEEETEVVDSSAIADATTPVGTAAPDAPVTPEEAPSPKE